MKKSTKGAFAAAAAGALLLGGAGTLANWTDSITGTGGTFTAGHMTLDNKACSGYVLGATPTFAGGLVTGSTLFVPGDTARNKCTATIHASGDHLYATVGTSGGTISPALPPGYVTATTVARFDSSAGPIATSITSADNGRTLFTTTTLAFDPTAGNESQDQSIDVSDYVVTLDQVPGH